jgi:hypothetical protein
MSSVKEKLVHYFDHSASTFDSLIKCQVMWRKHTLPGGFQISFLLSFPDCDMTTGCVYTYELDGSLWYQSQLIPHEVRVQHVYTHMQEPRYCEGPKTTKASRDLDGPVVIAQVLSDLDAITVIPK